MDSDTSGAKSRQHEQVDRVDSLSPGSASDALRHVRLETGHTLRTWDTGRTRGTGMMARTRIGYELCDPAGKVLFRGTDFGPSPRHADDADETLRGLCGFLFLRPGDTDRDYFAEYSAEQLAFAGSSECEQLAFLYNEEGPGTFADVGDCGSADGEGVRS